MKIVRAFALDMAAMFRALVSEFFGPFLFACTVGFVRAIRDEVRLIRFLRECRRG